MKINIAFIQLNRNNDEHRYMERSKRIVNRTIRRKNIELEQKVLVRYKI